MKHTDKARELYTASIASGSNGNCYYIGNEHDAVLVDVGISCRELETRMKRMGLHMDSVKAIFISHEHSDHIRGLAVVANKYQLPVFITEATLNACRLAIPARLLHLLKPGYAIHVGDLEVIPFSKPHDAADPQSFIIRQRELTVGVFTDIGSITDTLAQYFKQCDVVFLETNYDEQMLETGRYPHFLKRRIRGGFGHLSNREALELFRQHRPPRLKLLYLAHLSRDNNDPQRVWELFSAEAGTGTQVVLASRDAETRVYRLKNASEILKSEEKSVSYLDGVITIYQSCTIRWRMQSV